MGPIYNRYVPVRPYNSGVPTILHPRSDGGMSVYKGSLPVVDNFPSSSVGINTNTSKGMVGKLILSNKRPSYVPGVSRNYYPEFP